MYLKQIDIFGFKSFADKSKIVLSPGVTGVVGPNGSGKSNIADAVRWVLGEQSVRNLRGSKMEDVIFAGSELRKPTNLCEVSLTLDNSDGHLPVVFEEVTITRRVFRSGESEYFINRQPCRLKDIHELFMDTGLGRDAYSIIGQGKIEEMLSTRSEDRRGPFEDAAGIVKFKHRRKEAERRLEETKGNLVRVEDILAELEEQLGPLEKERDRAIEYRSLADSLEEGEITLLVVDIDKLKMRYEQAKESVQSRLAERDHAVFASTEAEAAWHQERLRLDELTSQVEFLQQSYVSMIEQRQKTQGDIALLEQELNYLESAQSTREQATQAQLSERLELEEQIETTRVSVQALEAQLVMKTSELEVAAEKSREGRKEVLARDLDDLSAQYIDANHAAATLRNELKMLSEQAQSEEGKRQRYEQDAQKWREQMETAKALFETMEMELAQIVEAMKTSVDEMNDIASRLEQAVEREAKTVSEGHRIASDAQALKARLELLKDLEEGYDGYALGVRTVMQQANRGALQGIHGSLAELIHVDKRLETAIETALGGALQNIVVKSEVDARAAINLLKQRQAGRATFMPLDVIQSRKLRDSDVNQLMGQQGYIGIASDLVDVSAPYRLAVEHVLGNVVIAETLEQAGALARRLQYRVRIVTLQGDVVAPGGLMSGGHTSRKGPGLLGRSREREEVEARLAGLATAEQALIEEKERLRFEVTQLQSLRSAAQQTLETHGTKKQALENQRKDAMYQQDAAQERLDALQWEYHQLTSGTDVLSKRKADAQDKLQATEQLLTRIQSETSAKREQLALFEQAQEAMQEQLTTLRIDVATLRQERDALMLRLNEMTQRLSRIQQFLAEATAESTAYSEKRQELTSRVETMTSALQDMLSAVSQREEDVDKARQMRLEREAEVRRLEGELARVRQAQSTAEELLHRAEVTAERADSDLAHALSKMGEAYGMTYEWAKSRYPLAVSEEALERDVQRLRKAIQALGEVHLGAIEEYERLEERVSFLAAQRDDLVAAQDGLVGLIGEIDTEMSNRFMETFRQIQTEFAKAFQILFNGGEASLSLTDPDQPLTTGIEVVAKPPGKRLQNLNLLSGGERALTAMALLFAILRVRPVPFCVLDEVEAALDEANVARFAQQLRLFAGDTQFIVITHRRGTMEEADALYGVTMPERGVSSMVSVRLTDDVNYETA